MIWEKMVQKIINIKLLLRNYINSMYINNYPNHTQRWKHKIDTKWKKWGGGKSKVHILMHFLHFCETERKGSLIDN